jgi:hypothetical protein
MINTKKWLPILFAAAILAASCATKPAAKAPAPAQQEAKPAAAVPTPTPGIAQADLDALLSRVQGMKKEAFDLKLYEVLPDDYKTADAAYADGKAAYDAKDAVAAKAKLESAASLFQDLTSRGVVELAAARRKDADSMKAAALKIGADSLVADRFGSGETAYAAGVDALGKADHKAAIAAFDRARILYELTYKRGMASGLKDRVDTDKFAVWDAGNAQLADSKLAEEADLFSAAGGASAAASLDTDSKNLLSGIDALDEAVLRYNLVIQKGRQGIAVGKKQGADEIKEKAENIKANVAVKDLYETALGLYEAGVAAFASGDYETATEKFTEAAPAFDKAYATAAEKRAKAEEAMAAASAASEQSLKKAQDADVSVGPVALPAAASTPTDTTPAPASSPTN